MQGWIDYVDTVCTLFFFLDDANPANIGQKVILPSSLSGGGGGGARYIHKRTQDAMPYVRKFGWPSLFHNDDMQRWSSLFITMTCNPSWPKLTNEFFMGNYLIIARTSLHEFFTLIKQKVLMAKITNCRIFADVIAYVCSIELQKRGFPHAHILIWSAAKNKLHGNLIDFVISAEKITLDLVK